MAGLAEKRMAVVDSEQDDERPDETGGELEGAPERRPEELRLRAVSDSHAPAEYRINGVVVNMPEFQKAFNCTIGSAMAPLKRCGVW